MYCNVCGNEIPAGGRYCGQCGRAVPGAEWRPPGRRTLLRPRSGRKIAGVCLGLANNLNMDVTLVRVLWVVLSVMLALVTGLVAYLVAWILIPEEPRAQALPAASGSAAPSE